MPIEHDALEQQDGSPVLAFRMGALAGIPLLLDCAAGTLRNQTGRASSSSFDRSMGRRRWVGVCFARSVNIITSSTLPLYEKRDDAPSQETEDHAAPVFVALRARLCGRLSCAVHLCQPSDGQPKAARRTSGTSPPMPDFSARCPVCIPFSIRVYGMGIFLAAIVTFCRRSCAWAPAATGSTMTDQKPDIIPHWRGHLPRNRRFSQSKKEAGQGARLFTGPAQAPRHDSRRSGWPRGLHPGEDALSNRNSLLPCGASGSRKTRAFLRQYDLAVRGAEKLAVTCDPVGNCTKKPARIRKGSGLHRARV